MESIEKKLRRLPPNLREEVNDFIDFLLSKKVPKRKKKPKQDWIVETDREPAEAKLSVLSEDEILSLAKKFYEENKGILSKKYGGKYIAILNNKVVGSDNDFSELAERVYKKYGYQTIYMPFVNIKEKVARIPSPRIKIR